MEGAIEASATGREAAGPPVLARARRLRPTPFTRRVEAAGVRAYSVYNHMLLPAHFGSLEDDYWHLLAHVQVWDVSVQRQVQVTGPDALRLAQMTTPRNLGGMSIGKCYYAPLVDETGGMVNDPILLRVADDRIWLSIADSDVLLWLKGLAAGLGLRVDVREPDVWPLAVQGPKSDDLAARVFGEAVRDLRFFRFGRLPFQGREMVVARSGWSRQGGFEIYVDSGEIAEPLWDALMDAGKDLGVRAGGPNLIERIEGGLLSYGNDVGLADTPFDCGLGKYCDLDGDFDFIGKAALAERARTDPRRTMRGLLIDRPREGFVAMTDGWPVTAADGAPAGLATSACFSPGLGRPIALAMLGEGHDAIGNRLRVGIEDGSVADAEVTGLPFPKGQGR